MHKVEKIDDNTGFINCGVHDKYLFKYDWSKTDFKYTSPKLKFNKKND